MNPVPNGAVEPAPAEAAGPAPSDAVCEASPEESEPTQAAMLNTAPTRSVTLRRPGLKNFVPTVGAIDCRNENVLYVGEILSWRVQKITLHP